MEAAGDDSGSVSNSESVLEVHSDAQNVVTG